MIVIRESEAMELVSSVRELTSEVKGLRQQLFEIREPPPKPLSDENYGINPDAIYDDADLQQITNMSKMSTYRWRAERKIKYIKQGGKIFYHGVDLIDFIKNYFRFIKKPITPIFKENPQGI